MNARYTRTLSEVPIFAAARLHRAGLFALCCLMALAGAAGAERPTEFDERMISPVTKELGIAPAEKVFVRGADDGGLTTGFGLPNATPEIPSGALSIQPDPIPASDGFTVRGRLLADESGGAVGIGLVAESSGAWLVAGILPSAEGWRLALWRAGIERAEIALAGSWTPTPGSWFMLEVEYSSSRGSRTWSVRAWPDGGERPRAAALTVLDSAARSPSFHPAIWASGTGIKSAASLELESVVKNSPDGAEEPEDWTLAVEDGDLVVRSGGEVVHRVSLESGGESDFSPGDGTRDARILTKSGSTCDGYRYRFSGVARGYPDSSATLLLPPRDNDCDGEFNEDPVNGLDDDGDGMVDEDPVWGPDRVLNWRSSDPELGEFETGDLPAAFLLIRRCFPRSRLTMAFAAVHNWSDPTWIAGWAQVSPYGSGRVGLAHQHDKVTYKLQPAPPELQVTILESGEPLADLSWFSRPVALDVRTEGGVGEVTITLNLDGQPIQPGEVVSDENTYRVTAEATDSSGAVAQTARTFSIDTTPPVLAITDPSDGSLIPDDTITVTGTVIEDNLSGLSVNGLFATVSGGVFTVPGVPIGDAETVLTATARDRAGHVAETSITVRRGSPGPPLVTLSSPVLEADACFAGGLTHTFSGAWSSSKPATGTGGEPAPLLLTVLTSDGVSSTFVPGVTGDGTGWTVENVSLGDGDGVALATVTATDNDGQRTIVSRSFRVDGAAPVLTLTLDGSEFPGSAPGEAPPTGTDPVLFARALAIRTSVADGPLGAPRSAVMTLDGAPYVSGTPIAAEGQHLVVAIVTDCAGHTASAHALFAIDLTAPQLLSTIPEDGALLPEGADTISGTADSELASATVNGDVAALNGTSFTLAPFAWREGLNTLEIVLVDAAGNESVFERSFNVDSIEPTVEILVGGLPIPAAALFTGAVTPVIRSNDPEAVLTATLDGSAYALGTLIGIGGTHTIEASATDALGRTATASATFEIDLSEGPAIAITAPAEGAVLTEPEATVSGTVEGRGATVTVNGQPAVVDGSAWSIADLPLESDVLNVITASARDAAGRSSAVSISVMVDSGGPQVLILEPDDGFVTNRRRVDVAGVVVGGARRTATGTVSVSGVSATVGPDGSFRALDIALVAGANTITAEVEDNQARTGQTAITVFSDLDPPSIRLLADGQPLAEGAAFGGPIAVRVEIEDESGAPPAPEVRLNGVAISASGPVVEFAVEQGGGYVLAVAASDLAGNQRRTERSFTITGGGCAVSDVQPSSGAAVSDDSVTIRGRGSGAEAVLVRVPVPDSDPVQYQEYQALSADNTFVAGDVPLPALGDNALEIACTDALGGSATTELTIYRLTDGDGPTIEIEAPVEGEWLSARTAQVSGRVSDAAASVTVNSLDALVTADGLFTVAVQLAEGPNVLVARARDEAGRSGRDRVVVWLDTRAPAVRIITPENNGWLGPAADGGSSVDVTGVVDLHTEPNLQSLVVATGQGSVEAAVDPDSGVFSAPSVPLDPAAGSGALQTISATASDSLGHSATSEIGVHFDAEGPAITLTAPPDLARYAEASPPEVAVAGTASGGEGAQVSLNGTTIDPLSLEWLPVGGGTRVQTGFNAAISRPVEEGAFGIVARTNALDGRWAGTRRLLFVDTTAPEVLETYPTDGTVEVDTNSLILVLFSEPMRLSSLSAADGLTLVRIDTGDQVVAQLAVAGNAVGLVPGAELAPDTEYRLRIGADAVDLVGHPLAVPYEAVFRTAVDPGGIRPVLDPLADIMCEEDLVLKGSAPANSSVRVTDGSLSFSSFADAAGRFELVVPVTHDGYHLLSVAIVDRDGRAGPAATAVVRVDCSAPTVRRVSFDPNTATIRLDLSEEVEESSATIGGPDAAIRLFDDEDPSAVDQTGSVQASSGGDVLDVLLDSASDAWWRDTVIRLVVDAPLADPQGNVMAAPFEARLFPTGGEGLSGSYLLGEAYDDTTGRPLAGARVRLFASGDLLPGAVPPGQESPPVAEAATDSRGRYQIVDEVSVGRYTLVVEADGFARVVRRLDLEPAVGTVAFDARLTPLAGETESLDPVAGARIADADQPLLVLDADPGAVPGLDPLTVHLAPRSPQALPDFLPLGWTPAAAADVALEDAAGPLPDGEATPFAADAVHLELPLPDWVQPADALYAVRYRLAGGAWLTLDAPELIEGPNGEPVARVTLIGPGSVAVVIPDEGATAPPLPALGVGRVLRGVARPSSLPELDGELVLDPPVIAATGRSHADVIARSADGESPWPSGIAVQAYLEERLVLAGGGEVVESPFVADLLLYRPRLDPAALGTNTADSVGAVDFIVSPSERASAVLLEVGYEDITLYPFPEELERGQVLGAAGGTVTSPDGVELSLPEGALPSRTAVSASLLTDDELAGLAAVPGFDTLAAVRLDFGGRTLARPATLSLDAPESTPESIDGDPRLVLTELVESAADGRGSYNRLAARIGRIAGAGSGDRLRAAPENIDSGLPLIGIVREGTYLVLSAQAPIAYATGFVRAPNGLGLAAARVTADNLGTADLSVAGGRYTAVVPTAPGALLTATHPTLDENGSAEIPAVQPADIITLDITVTPVPPEVVELTPAAGAVDVTVGTPVVVQFSKDLDAASVGLGTLSVVLADRNGNPTGAVVSGSVAVVDDTQVVFESSLPLAPGRTFVARFTGGVADAGGVFYTGGPVSWTFTTSDIAAPGGQIHPERFHLRIPVDGVAEVYGDDGALPTVAQGQAPWTVSPWVNSPVADPVRPSCGADSTGGFGRTPLCSVGHPPDFPVTIESEVWVTVFDPFQTIAAEFRLGVFTTPDGRGFVAPPGEAVSFTSTDDPDFPITVEVPEGAFDEPTLVTVTKLEPETLGVEHPQGLALGAFIDVDFDGEASETLRIKVPAPEGIEPDAQVFIGEPMSLPWGEKLKFLSVGGVLEEDEDLYLSNDPSLQPEPEPDDSTKSLGGRRTCYEAREEGLPECFLASLLGEFAYRSTAAFFYEQGADWTILSGGLSNYGESVGFANSVFYNFLADLFIYLPVPHDWSGHVVLPIREGTSYRIVERDISTGWILSEQGMESLVPEDTDFIFDAGVLNDESIERPLLIGGSPFDFIRFRPPQSGETDALRLEVEVEGEIDGDFSIRTVDEFPLPGGTGIAVYNIDPRTNLDPTTGDWNGPQFQMEPTFTCLEPSLVDFTATDAHLLVVGPGDLRPEEVESFELQFDRPLDEDFNDTPLSSVAWIWDLGPTDECSIVYPGAEAIPLEIRLTNNFSRLVLTPVGKLPAGHNFWLQLNDEALVPAGGDADYAYSTWGSPQLKAFPFATRPVPGDPITTGMDGANNGAFDLLQFGNITMVGTRQGEIQAVDTTSPVIDGERGRTSVIATHSGAAGQVRSFATDGHNRLFFNGRYGGTWAVKAIAMEVVRESTDGTFEPVAGGVVTSYALGAGPPLSASEFLALGALPTGTPVDMEVVIQDEIGDSLELVEFYDRYVGDFADDAPIPDAEGFYTLDFAVDGIVSRREGPETCPYECDFDRYQRITVDNLTTGQRWTSQAEHGWADCGGEPGAAEFTITARRGDQLRIRHNLRALGYVAVLGSGITVVDLNRMYGLPMVTASVGGAQCGRRLGQFQGQGIDFFQQCSFIVGSGPDGLAMSTALAAQGPTGCDADGCSRGSERINVYSPLRHVGAVTSFANRLTPGDLDANLPLACIRDIKTGVVHFNDEDQWVTERVFMRDVAIANDVTWIDKGVTGSLEGLFNADREVVEPEKRGDLAFLTLGDLGVMVFDVSERHLNNWSVIGLLSVSGHSIHRLQFDEARNLLFAGGYDGNGPVIDIWDIKDVNGAPDIKCGEDVDFCPEGTNTSPRPMATLEGVPWTTNHLGIDASGTGLLHTFDGESGVTAVPFASPRIRFMGLYQPEADSEVFAEARPYPEQRPSRRFVPLGVPMEASLYLERERAEENDRQETAAVKLRVALPGSVGEVVTAKVQSLRVLPEDLYLGQKDVGKAEAPPAGDCWLRHEVVVTLRRVGLGDDEDGVPESLLNNEGGHYAVGYNLYESEQTVLLLADPRARRDYVLQDLSDGGLGGASDASEIADEKGQCRRCEWPEYLPEPESTEPADVSDLEDVKELLATGRFLRAFLFAPDCEGADPSVNLEDVPLCGGVTQEAIDNTTAAISFFKDQGDNYRRPAGSAEVVAWADTLPSPTQAALAEPVLNPAIWSPGEAGVSVSLVGGDAMLGAVDQSVPGRSIPFLLERSYRSGVLSRAPLGVAGWSSRLFAHLRAIPTTGEVEYHDGRGNVWRFYPLSADSGPSIAGAGAYYAVAEAYDVAHPGRQYVAPKGLYLDLEEVPGGGWRLIGRHNDSAIFDRDGRLIELRDRHRKGKADPDEQGSTMFLEYDIFGQLKAVEDDLGRRYRLNYQEVVNEYDYGLLKLVTDFAGREIEYSYDDRRRLEIVGLPEVSIGAGDFVDDDFPFEGDDGRPKLTYKYHDGGEGALDPDSTAAPLHECYADLRLEGYKLPPFGGVGGGDEGLRVRLEYDATTGRVARVVFPGNGDQGGSPTWEIDGQEWVRDAGPAEAARVTSPWDHAVEFTLEDGRIDTIEEMVEVTAIDGTATATTATTRFAYEDDGRAGETVRPDGSTRTVEYEPETGSRRSAANIKSLVAGGDSGNSTHGPPTIGFSKYNSDNLAESLEDPLGRAIDRVVPEVPEEPGEFRFSVFHPGDVTDTAVSFGYQFDVFARVLALEGGVSPSKAGGTGGPKVNLSYGLDEKGRAGAGLLEGAVSGNGLSQRFDYDDFDNLDLVEQQDTGAVSRALYDEWDRPISTLTGGSQGGALGVVGSGTCGGSQNWGTDGGQLTERAFDPAGHLVRERRCQDFINDQGAEDSRWVEFRYIYNQREQLTEVHQSHLGAPGQPGAVDSRMTLVLTLGYDEFGRLQTRTIPNLTELKLEALYDYDSAGRPSGTTVGDGGRRRTGYDINGRVNYRNDGELGSWFGIYDGFDRLYREHLPTGATVDRVFDAAGNVVDERVSDSSGLLSHTASHFTSFGAADMSVVFLDEDVQSPDQVRITRRLFDASGRTTTVLSGPTVDFEAPGGPFQLELDPAETRVELQNIYESFGSRLAFRYFGGCFEGPGCVPGSDAPGYGEQLKYELYNINTPWPDEIVRLEQVPDQEDLVPTVWTRFERDLQGRPLTVVSSDGSILHTAYDRLGGAIRTETGAGTIHRMVYDSRGLLLGELRPEDRGRTVSAYEVDGRLLSRSTQHRTIDGEWADLWKTTFIYTGTEHDNRRGLPSQINHPDGTFELFAYNLDDSVDWMKSRDDVRLEFDYDSANRVVGIAPVDVAESAREYPLVPLDVGDRYRYDGLSRVRSANRAATADEDSPVRVQTDDYDLGGRLRAEVVASRPALEWTYDTWDHPETVTLPVGAGRGEGSFTGFERHWDSLDRVTRIDGLGSLEIGADWVWGGQARLYGIGARGPVGTSSRYAYIGQPDTLLPTDMPDYGEAWRLATINYGADAESTATRLADEHTWGGFGFGWRGTEGDPRDGAKVGRVVTGAGITGGMGWSWDLDVAMRLVEGHSGAGSYLMGDSAGAVRSLGFSYGEGDQLERMTRSDGDSAYFAAAEQGRIRARSDQPFPEGSTSLRPDDIPFGYDAVGRRTLDDRFSYRWDWRGRLYEVTVASDAGTPYDGHQVQYEYDAVGRLLYRVHLAEDDGAGNRSFIEYRAFVWEGNGLIAEAGYGSNDGTWDEPDTDLFLRWRKTYVPGASGLDDAVQVRVEIEVPAGSGYDGVVYSYLRDELGTVLALVEEADGADPADPPVVARYLYTPYGEAGIAADEFDYDSIVTASSTFDGRFPGGQNCLFQGLWTDPVTGIAYARNRWYDARTANWLSEDPKGTVDSTNLYAFVGWGPHVGRDPMGSCNIWGIPIGGDPDVSCFDVLADAMPYLGGELKGEADLVRGIGVGLYESPDVFGERAASATISAWENVKEFAISPSAYTNEKLASLGSTIHQTILVTGAIANTDSDVLVMYVSDAAASEWRELLNSDKFELGRSIGHEAPIIVLSEIGGEVLFAPKALRAAEGFVDALDDLPYWLAVAEGVESRAFGLSLAERLKLAAKRPSRYRAGVVDTVWERAQDSTGRVFDPNTLEELTWDRARNRNSQWDMGHLPGKSYAQLRKRFIEGEISRKEFLDEYHNPDNYRPEGYSPNRSRKYD